MPLDLDHVSDQQALEELGAMLAPSLPRGWGRFKAIAEFFGVHPSAVSHWLKEGVPPKRRFKLWRRLGEGGVRLSPDFVERAPAGPSG